MKLCKLKNKIDFFIKLKFPSFPKDEQFYDWMISLIEIEAYYVGLITSKESEIEIESFKEIKEKLLEFEHLREDREIFDYTKTYITKLEELIFNS